MGESGVRELVDVFELGDTVYLEYVVKRSRAIQRSGIVCTHRWACQLAAAIAADGAVIQTAVQEGTSFGENIAWGYVELGKLDMRTDIEKAEKQFKSATTIVLAPKSPSPTPDVH